MINKIILGSQTGVAGAALDWLRNQAFSLATGERARFISMHAVSET